ncbi:MAG: DegT/DnrJ/EryC1/StrS family aminotransferase [Phycisphaerales bacterium]
MSHDITVPLLDLKAQYATLRDEIEPVVREVIEAQWFIMGPKVSGLEEDVAAYTGANHAIGCGSGSDALLLALMALGIGHKDEVICPSFTFFATGGAIHRLGAIPVFADIDPVTYQMDPEHVRELAKKCTRLKAIMPVHLFGMAADMDAYTKLGTDLGVPIIEDAAQAIGTKDNTGAMVGTRGTVGCFSFFPSKNLGGFGDGGIITTNCPGLGEKMGILRVHGGKPKYYHRTVGVNSRLDALQAAVLQVKLRHLEAWHQGRIDNADFYDAAFGAAGAVNSSSPIKDGGFPLRTPWRPDGQSRHIFNQYVVRVPADIRDDVRADLGAAKIGSEIYYPVPLHMQECFEPLGYTAGSLPHSELAAHETIALPIYPELTTEQKQHVVDTLVASVAKRTGVAATSSGTKMATAAS